MLKYEKAIVCYELSINFNPGCSEAYNNLGVIYKDQDNLEKAIQCYQAALTINPKFSQTLNNIGVVYTVQGKVSAVFS
jgi:tetratricopeptide (TPR) repeat protein